MKRNACVLLLCLTLIVASFHTSMVAAQGGDGQLETWLVVANEVMNAYDALVNADNTIETIAQIQQLQRRLDAAPRPPIANKAYEAWTRTFNLHTQGIVATLVNNNENLLGTGITSADLLAQAVQEHSIAVSETVALMGPPSGDIATFTPPDDVANMPWQYLMTGSYNPNLLGDNDLWVFVIPPSKSWYPQAFNGCEVDRAQRLSVQADPMFNEWSVTTFIGAENDQGKAFRLVLTYASPDIADTMWDKFDVWCSNQSFTGLAAEEVQELGFQYLDHVDVTRG